MVYRLSWVAGIAGLGLALMRLNTLVRSSTEGAPWQLVVVAGALLGAVITWTAISYKMNTVTLVAANAVALVVTATRIAVPDTTVLLLPTFESFRAMRVELGYAFDVIRSGVAPVLPASGLVVVVTAVFWLLGALLVWGLLTKRPYFAVVPPIVLYLQLATADRGFAGIGWTLAFITLVGGSLAAVTLDERNAGTGRLTRTRRAAAGGGVISSASLVTVAVAAVVTLVTTGALANAVPTAGVLEWRNPSGLTGGYYGSVSYNPFISIQKSLVDTSDTPLFTAKLNGDVDPEGVYWRLLTMDTFNGVYWYADSPRVVSPNEGPFESADQAFAGPTTQVIQSITIQQLRNDWLPAVYAPQALVSDNRQVARGYRVAEDSSLRFGSLSFRGMQYQVVSDLPTPDLGVLAAGADGGPTQAFAEAVAAGDLGLAASPADVRSAPSRYTALPDETDPRIQELAEGIIEGLESDYERGLALEAWLRSPANGFEYSLAVPPGQESSDIANWLFDTESPNYRSGYCEQYATSLGVLARSVGIPSRVVLGFTPGRALGDGTVVVLDSNAHAWVELWMPAQGWVRFDATPRADGVNPSALDEIPFDISEFLVPTAAPLASIETADLPGPILEPLDEPPARPDIIGAGEVGAERTFSLPGWLSNAIVVAAALALLLGAVPLVKWWRRRRRLARLRTGDIGAAWKEIVARLTDLGEEVRPSMTPLEVAESTDRALRPLASVYTESVYGPGGSLGVAEAEIAEDSFAATEAAFTMKYSPARRLGAAYRLRSLTPRWVKRRRKK